MGQPRITFTNNLERDISNCLRQHGIYIRPREYSVKTIARFIRQQRAEAYYRRLKKIALASAIFTFCMIVLLIEEAK